MTQEEYDNICKLRDKACRLTERIADETSHDQSTIGYYLRRYDSEYKYNREFRAAAEKVATLLSEKLNSYNNVSK